MKAWIGARWQDIQTGLWFVPGAIALSLGALAFVFLRIDRSFSTSGTDQLFGGDASAARDVLATVAGSLITVAGLTFSVTIVVLQLASSQYSPRVLRTFLSDRITQLTAGTFIGLFVYCLLVLRAVRGGEEDDFVPSLSITAALALALLALALLLVFISHLASLVQIDNILARIHASLDRHAGIGEPAPHGNEVVLRWRHESGRPVYGERPGFVRAITPEQLAQLPAGRWRIEARARPGDFVHPDDPIALVYGEANGDVQAAVRSAFLIANERDVAQDPGFALRQLADVALKAISPSVNDPTTAVTCVGYLRSGLVTLAGREPRAALHELRGGEVLFAVPGEPLVVSAEPVLQVGRHSARVPEVGAAVLAALAAVAATARRSRPGEAAVLAERTKELAEFLIEHAAPESARTRLRDA